jgi:sugar lactone lactonase YvrE
MTSVVRLSHRGSRANSSANDLHSSLRRRLVRQTTARHWKLLVVIAAALAASLSIFASVGAADTGLVNPRVEGSLVFGPDGDFYFIDGQNYQVDRLDASGHVTVVAGRGFLEGNNGYPVTTNDHGHTEDTGYTGDGGPAVDAQLSLPIALAFDGQGNLYISDHGNDVIRKVDTNGIITTVAGVGPSDTWVKGPWVPGIQPKAGDGGPATQAVLASPWGITFDAQGNLYIADRDHNAIRKVDTNGIMTTVAGTGQRGYSGDSGPAAKAKLNGPLGVVFDAAGDMYIADQNNARVRKVDTNGIITTIGGTGDVGCSGNGGAATSAMMANPHGIALGPDGSLYVSEGDCNAVRKITPNGTLLPVLGTGVAGCSGFDGGPAVSAQVTNPGDITFDTQGNLYVGDPYAYLNPGECGGVLQVDTAGNVHQFIPALPG